MPNKTVPKARGVWEKETGSGEWWIRYSYEGRTRKEKAGTPKCRYCPVQGTQRCDSARRVIP
jgi:hypothetical protein